MADVNHEKTLAKEWHELADEVEAALKKYAVYDYPRYGKERNFESDCFGNRLFMDDANVPGLLAIPYLGDVPEDRPVYQDTRKLIWSEGNPYS